MRSGICAAELNSLVSLRIGDDTTDYPSRVEGIDADTVLVAAPIGAPAALMESGGRVVEVSWPSKRGRHCQRCLLVERTSGRSRLWRLRPTGEPELLQRRRFVRARATIPVVVALPGATVPGVTVDLSEGGMRIRIERCVVPDETPVHVQIVLDGDELALAGQVVRALGSERGWVELVVTFDTECRETDAIRRFVFELQLRARAVSRA